MPSSSRYFAKHSRRQRQSTRKPTPTVSIRDFYKIGTEFLKATGGERSPPGIAEELAENRQYSQVAIYKARQFAEMYSQEELEELCSLRKPDGLPLGIGHVYQLIQVEGRGERKRLQKDAAKNCWSSRKLKAERMQKRGYKVPTNVGRKQR